MLLAKINPAAEKITEVTPFSSVTTSLDYMTAIAKPQTSTNQDGRSIGTPNCNTHTHTHDSMSMLVIYGLRKTNSFGNILQLLAGVAY